MKTLFIHIPKCAGIAMRSVFPVPNGLPKSMTHLTLEQWRVFLGSAIRYYRTLTVVRHPADRFVSAFSYLSNQTQAHPYWLSDKAERLVLSAYDDANHAAMDLHHVVKLPHFKPMMHWGVQDCDIILRLENLAETMPRLPMANTSPRGNWRDELSIEAVSMIEEVYAEDYEQFGYKKEQND